MVAGELRLPAKQFKLGGLTFSHLGSIVHFNHLIDAQGLVFGFEIIHPLEPKITNALSKLASAMGNVVKIEEEKFQITLNGHSGELESDLCIALGGDVFTSESSSDALLVFPDCIQWAGQEKGFELIDRNLPVGIR